MATASSRPSAIRAPPIGPTISILRRVDALRTLHYRACEWVLTDREVSFVKEAPMKVRRVAAVLMLALAGSTAAFAQGGTPQQQPQQPPPPAKPEEQEKPPVYEEQVVVTAS